jgi:hypothetical protein
MVTANRGSVCYSSPKNSSSYSNAAVRLKWPLFDSGKRRKSAIKKLKLLKHQSSQSDTKRISAVDFSAERKRKNFGYRYNADDWEVSIASNKSFYMEFIRILEVQGRYGKVFRGRIEISSVGHTFFTSMSAVKRLIVN